MCSSGTVIENHRCNLITSIKVCGGTDHVTQGVENAELLTVNRTRLSHSGLDVAGCQWPETNLLQYLFGIDHDGSVAAKAVRYDSAAPISNHVIAHSVCRCRRWTRVLTNNTDC